MLFDWSSRQMAKLYLCGLSFIKKKTCDTALIYWGTLSFKNFVSNKFLGKWSTASHVIHQARACHVIFKRGHGVQTSTKYRAGDLCVNLVCEYFCWMLDDSHFFFGRLLPFLILSITLKNKKKSVRGKV